MIEADANRAVEAVWRIESPRLVAGLARLVNDVGIAEELAQDALVAALEQWPAGGVPANPGAWLMSTAKHRAIDRVRRNEGYAATAGDDLMRPALCEEALRLGRVLAELTPADAEVHGLVALIELQHSRRRSRTDVAGDPVLLFDQNRSRWDRTLINHGLRALARAEELADPPGPYTLQAQIAACHARARSPEETDWARIVDRYEALAALTGSAVVELNRAVAISMAHGPALALELVDELASSGELGGYLHLPSVRADLLERLERPDEAALEFEKAAALADNERLREQLAAKAAALRSAS